MAKYSIGIYIRLSLADIDLSRKEGKTESESITNQRALINRYLDKHEEFEGCPREEFFDDGYSGTNFARPSFEKMMEKVKKGKINTSAALVVITLNWATIWKGSSRSWESASYL